MASKAECHSVERVRQGLVQQPELERTALGACRVAACVRRVETAHWGARIHGTKKRRDAERRPGSNPTLQRLATHPFATTCTACAVSLSTAGLGRGPIHLAAGLEIRQVIHMPRPRIEGPLRLLTRGASRGAWAGPHGERGL